jgi:hypothetical protein
MFAPMLGILAASMPLQAAAASHLSFSLVATVPVMCSIRSIAPVPGSAMEIDVTAHCNAERFALELGGEWGGARIAGVTTASGAASLLGTGVVTHADRPGLQQLRLTLSEELAPDARPSLSIAAI